MYRPTVGWFIGRLSVDNRSTIGRLSVDYQPIVGRLPTDSRPIVNRYVGRLSPDMSTESTYSTHDPILFSNRTTPSSVTGQTPAESFLKRRPRTRLDLLRPNLGRKISDRQIYDKAEHDRKSKEHEFSIGEEVLVQNFRCEPKWLERTGLVS